MAEAEEIPFLGFFSPASGIETLPIPKTFAVPKSLLTVGLSCYAIQMQSDELLEEGILGGDLLIVAVGVQPKPGQGALIRDGREWWLRRVEPAGDYLCLESLTQRSAPVFRSAEQIEVFAVLLALWRHYDTSSLS
jgi:SOS-response transcriptional repressor LexA